MEATRRKILTWAAIVAGVLLLALFAAGVILSRRFEPFIREQTIAYLEKRFDSEVELGALSVSLPLKSPFDLLARGGKGVKAHVKGQGISIRPRKRPEAPPLLAMSKFFFEVDLNSLFNRAAIVNRVHLEGLQINMPPKGQRPAAPKPEAKPVASGKPMSVLIEEIVADGATLTILPRDPSKAPLVFELHNLRLESAGPGVAMRYKTTLTNAKPPGIINCEGTFGPWVTGSPSDSPLTGKYEFNNADLGVFKGIAGTLASTGEFKGQLNEIEVDGETRTPDFRLTMSGNKVPLTTQFHAIVDGTNGNTLLQPVEATLGATSFDVRGGVVRNAGEKGKTVSLDAVLKRGRLEDLLLLAMKGSKPFMSGGIRLRLKFTLPPGKGEISDRLQLAGSFSLIDARFNSRDVQDGIDSLSQRALGQPGQDGPDEVPSQMEGRFDMAAGRITFSKLKFAIPGAQVDLTGRFVFDRQELDFHGLARTQARVSQMMVKKWKRVALKPVDPFFAKDGYGTVAKIKITGTRDKPQFGLNR